MSPFVVRFVLGISAVLLIVPGSQAQTWTAAASGNWSLGANWSPGAPASGSTTALTFPSSNATAYTATNDIANPFVLNALTINNTGTGTITIAPAAAGGALSFAGANPTMTVSGSGPENISAPVNFAAATTVQGAGTGTLVISGPISNTVASGTPGALIVNTVGTLSLTGGGTLNDGTTTQTAGYIHVGAGGLVMTAGNYAPNFFGATGGAAGLSAMQVNGGTAGNPTQFNISGGASLGGNAIFFGRYASSVTASTVNGFGTSVSTFDVGTTSAGFGQFTIAGRASPVATLTVSNGGLISALGTQGLVMSPQEPGDGTLTVTGVDVGGHRSTANMSQLRLGGGAGIAGGTATINIQSGAILSVLSGSTAGAGNAFLGL